MMNRLLSTVAACTLPLLALGTIAAPTAADAQVQSRLVEITKSGKLRVCQYPMYYAISFRDPTTGEITGIDADMSKELAKELDVELEIVESAFGTFIADIQANKCDIGMFGIGATLARAQAVEFSKPYLKSSIFGIVRQDSEIKDWADIDQPGVTVVTTLGSYVEPFLRGYLKEATLSAISPPATREGELMAGRADVVMTDYPTAMKLKSEFDWPRVVASDVPLSVTPYAYVVPQGDQVWLNYVNLFIDTVAMDGRLEAFAEKHGLTEILVK